MNNYELWQLLNMSMCKVPWEPKIRAHFAEDMLVNLEFKG